MENNIIVTENPPRDPNKNFFRFFKYKENGIEIMDKEKDQTVIPNKNPLKVSGRKTNIDAK